MCPDTLLGLLFLVVTAGVNMYVCLAGWHYKCSSLCARREEINDGLLWKGCSALGKLEGICFLSLMLAHLKNTKSTQPAHCLWWRHKEKLKITSVK